VQVVFLTRLIKLKLCAELRSNGTVITLAGLAFIAQELEQVFLSWCIIAQMLRALHTVTSLLLLVEAVKELSTQITELKLEVARLRGGL
jgi:hypothetical protein